LARLIGRGLGIEDTTVSTLLDLLRNEVTQERYFPEAIELARAAARLAREERTKEASRLSRLDAMTDTSPDPLLDAIAEKQEKRKKRRK